MKKIISIFLVISCGLALFSCSQTGNADGTETPANPDTMATMDLQTTDDTVGETTTAANVAPDTVGTTYTGETETEPLNTTSDTSESAEETTFAETEIKTESDPFAGAAEYSIHADPFILIMVSNIVSPAYKSENLLIKNDDIAWTVRLDNTELVRFEGKYKTGSVPGTIEAVLDTEKGAISYVNEKGEPDEESKNQMIEYFKSLLGDSMSDEEKAEAEFYLEALETGKFFDYDGNIKLNVIIRLDESEGKAYFVSFRYECGFKHWTAEMPIDFLDKEDIGLLDFPVTVKWNCGFNDNGIIKEGSAFIDDTLTEVVTFYENGVMKTLDYYKNGEITKTVNFNELGLPIA